MARSSDEATILAGGASPAVLLPLRRGLAVRIAEFAVLLVRALAIVLMLSPIFLVGVLLLR